MIEAENSDVRFPVLLATSPTPHLYTDLTRVSIVLRWRFSVCGFIVRELPRGPEYPCEARIVLIVCRSGSLTETLSSAVARGVEEHGRTYASYGNEGASSTDIPCVRLNTLIMAHRVWPPNRRRRIGSNRYVSCEICDATREKVVSCPH